MVEEAVRRVKYFSPCKFPTPVSRRCLTMPEETIASVLETAQQHLTQNNPQMSEDLCRKVLAVEPEQPLALYICANALQLLGRFSEALELVEAMIPMAPGLEEPRQLAVSLCLIEGEFERMSAHATVLTEANPENGNYWWRLADAAFYSKDWNTSLEAFTKVKDLTEGTSEDVVIAVDALEGKFQKQFQERDKGSLERSVTFVSDLPGAREVKIARLLSVQGWNVNLLCRQVPSYDKAGAFHTVSEYESSWQAVKMASNTGDSIVHVFARLDYETTYALVVAKPAIVVLDIYDSITGMLKDVFPVSRVHRKIETTCIELADGHVCRSLETQYGQRTGAYQINGPRLFFPDYSSGEIENPEKLSDTDGELHVAFGGAIWTKAKYGEIDLDYMWLAEILVELNVHFHIYPMYYNDGVEGVFERDFADYIKLAESSPFFHLHQTVPGSEWLAELSKYDIVAEASECLFENKSRPQYHVDKAKLGYSNKLPDAVDAGAYYLSNPGFLDYRLARRLGIAIPVEKETIRTVEFWNNVVERCKNRKNDFAVAHRLWDGSNQVVRLESFYERLARGQNLE
jgi:tetratricopeptide (TPR) repeat protein